MSTDGAESTAKVILPRLRVGVEVVDHGSWSVAAAPFGGRFLRLSPAEAAWVKSGLPGTTDAPAPAPPDSEDLLKALKAGGFLEGTPLDHRRVQVTTNGLEFAGPQRWLAAAYRGGLHHLFRPSFAGGAVVVVLAGVVALVAQIAAGHELATEAFSPIAAGLILLGLSYGALIFHECAHALYLIHCGRQVRGVGVGFYWGALSFFVNAGEALMLPRRDRAMQAAAGPFADAVLAGAASLIALVVDGPLESILLLYAVFAWLDVATNLVPFLELDGYWILADLLDRPQLRSEAWQAVRQAARTRRSDTPWLAAYGAASITFGLVVLGLGLFVWWRVVGDLLQALVQEGVLGWLIALPLALPVILGWATMILQLVALASRAGTTGQRAAE